MSNIDIYGPCSCGGNKKLKFCCYQKGKELETLRDRDLSLRANQFPQSKCFINADWIEAGIAQVFVVRRLISQKLLVGIYIVDTFCLGLKNSFIRSHISEKDLPNMLLKGELDMEEISYEDARSVIFGAIEFANQFSLDARGQQWCFKYS